MLSGLIGKLHGIYAMDKFKVYLCTIPTPLAVGASPCPLPGGFGWLYFLGDQNGKPKQAERSIGVYLFLPVFDFLYICVSFFGGCPWQTPYICADPIVSNISSSFFSTN